MQHHCDFVLEVHLPSPRAPPGQAAAQAAAPKALTNAGCLLPLLTSSCRPHHPCTCWPASVINIIHIESCTYLLNSSAVVSSLASCVTLADKQLSSTSSTYLLTSKCHQHHQHNCWTAVVSPIASCVTIADQQLSSTSSTYLLTSKCHQHHQHNCWTAVVSSIASMASCVPAADQQADVARKGPPGCTPKALGDAGCQTKI